MRSLEPITTRYRSMPTTQVLPHERKGVRIGNRGRGPWVHPHIALQRAPKCLEHRAKLPQCLGYSTPGRSPSQRVLGPGMNGLMNGLTHHLLVETTWYNSRGCTPRASFTFPPRGCSRGQSRRSQMPAGRVTSSAPKVHTKAGSQHPLQTIKAVDPAADATRHCHGLLHPSSNDKPPPAASVPSPPLPPLPPFRSRQEVARPIERLKSWPSRFDHRLHKLHHQSATNSSRHSWWPS